MAEQLEVDLIVKAISEGFSKVSEEMGGIKDSSEGAGEGVKKSGEEADKSSTSFHELESKLNLASRAYNQVASAIIGTLNEVAAYTEGIDTVSRTLGVSAEEASRLSNMFDDLRINQQEMTVGFRNAIDQGINPSIASLKNLSEQYLAITDPVERAQFAMDTFGARSGLAFQKILELGPETIDTMAGANEALVVDDAAVQSMKDYQASVNSLKDAAMGLKMVFVEAIGPGTTAFIQGSTALLNAIGAKLDASTALADAEKAGIITGEQYNEILWDLQRGAIGAGGVMAILTDATINYTNAEETRYTATYQSNQATQDAIDVTAEYADVQLDAVSGTEESGEALEEWAFQQEAARSSAELATQAAEEQAKAMQEDAKAAADAKKAHEDLTMSIIGTGSMSSPIASYIEDLKYLSAGGGAIAVQVEAVMQALTAHAITPDQAQAMLGELYVAAQAIEVEIGVTTEAEAVENIGETLGITDAQAALDGVQSQLDTITSTYFTEQFVMDLGIEMTPDAANTLAILNSFAENSTITVEVVVTGDSVTQITNSTGGTNYD